MIRLNIEETEKIINSLNSSINLDRVIELTSDSFDHFDIEYNEEVLIQIIKASIKAKNSLYMKLSKSPFWNESKFRIELPVVAEVKPNFYQVREVFSDILSILYWEYDNIYINGERHNFYNLCYDIVHQIQTVKAGENLAREINRVTGGNISQNKTTSKALSFFINWLIENVIKKYGVEYKINGQIERINNCIARIGDLLKNKTLTKNVCYSIAFNDYMTMSNGVSWHSCHANDGCYCAGSTSYALDTTTIIVYEENDNDIFNKVWRQCYYLSDYALMYSRYYGGIEKEVIKQSALDFLKTIGLNWKKIEENENCGESLYPSFFHSKDSSAHYPDYKYNEYTIFKTNDNIDIKYNYIGSSPRCFKCGDKYHNNENRLYCEKCEGVYCAECGQFIGIDDVIHHIGGEYYCDNCVVECECCHDYVLKSDASETVDGIVCDDCIDRYYVRCEKCDNLIKEDEAVFVIGSYGWIPYCNNCSYIGRDY